MRMHVGIAVTGTDVRAVGIRRGRVEWGLQSDVVDGETLGASVGALLDAAPLNSWPRPIVFVALGAPFARVKALVGLPPLKQHRLLAQTVGENLERFFLRGTGPLLAGGVRIDSDGRVLGSAFDESAVEAVCTACSSRGLNVKAVVPALAVVPAAASRESIDWEDGALAVRLTIHRHQLVATQQMATGERMVPPTSDIDPRLTPLGTDAPRYLAAFGAAVRMNAEPLGMVPGERDRSTNGGVSRWRLAVAAFVLLFSSAGAVAAPVLASAKSSREARVEIASLASPRSTALALNRQIAEKTGALERITTFEATRRSTVGLLADITRLLPPEAALVAFRIDSVSGTLVALAPRAGAMISRLEKSPFIVAPEMLGPLTREVAGGREYERVTIRFRLAPHPRRPDAVGSESPK